MQVEKILKRIEEEIERNKNVPIIVEGDRDILALRKLGFEGEIIKINTGKNLEDFSTKISKKYKEITLLFDWDSKGIYLTKRVINLLKSYGIKCHTELWEFFLKFSVGSVEELPSYLRILEAQAP